MMSSIRYCPVCKEYTLEEKCRVCGGNTVVKKPARFSPEDRYGSYRVSLKRMERSEGT
ncbi:MAG: RNA-protein complex protein Nop10 [Thermoplasmata archaeon]|nr:RNA-protein complex protein Nop10 [Thermoplasmata archaeon]RLF27643.1 MAG: RNA-protein complex protein Nop10 [Thermoplasmata archaeon]HHH80153.1 RNA-protein complex protein Nop10 [Thermoplasmatales archaeon]